MDWTTATNFLIAMLAITNPLGKVPLWLEASAREDAITRRYLAVFVVASAFAILLLALLFGRQVLAAFGISLASFRIGGGVIILLIAAEMLHGNAIRIDPRDEDGPPRVRAQSRFRQVAVPMTVPILAGPGSISTAVIYGTQARSVVQHVLMGGILLGVMLTVLGTLLAGPWIRRAIGSVPLTLTTRLFALILAAIAAQLLVDGLREAFPVLKGAGG